MFRTTELVKSVFQLILWGLIIYGVYLVRATLIYIVIAGLITIVGKPLVHFFSRIKLKGKPFPTSIRALMALLTILLLFLGINALIIPAFIQEVSVLSNIRFGELWNKFYQEFDSVNELLNSLDINQELNITNVKHYFSQVFNAGTIQNTISTLFGGLGNIAIAVFSILFISFFLLKQENLASKISDGFFPDKMKTKLETIIPKIKKTISKYLFALLIQMGIIFILVFIGLELIGVKDTVVIALFAALINVIPYIGPMIGISFGMVLGVGQALVYESNPDLGFWAMAIFTVFVVVQLFDNFITQPFIFSNSINAHPLEIFLVISIAGTLAGIAGMIIAVPFYSILRIIVKEMNVNYKFIQTLTKDA